MEDTRFRLYSGDGRTIEDRKLELPPFEQPDDDPANYLADEGLCDAVNVALALGQPLLVTGEPGTGKTQLAGSVAYQLKLDKPLVFHAKTTSTAKDLFYRYEALRHFHDSHFHRENVRTEPYISYEALGLAILLSMPPKEANPHLPEFLRDQGPRRSVVLIDEIDKAPRDFPNDVLDEVENLRFIVKETGQKFSANQRYRPILILTSNSEKNLPDAFLRRCVFYHIAFPDERRLQQIVQRRLKMDSRFFTPQMLDHAIRHFTKIRQMALKKNPATAEFLAWVRIFKEMKIDAGLKPGENEAVAMTYSILAKNPEDLARLRKDLKETGSPQ